MLKAWVETRAFLLYNKYERYDRYEKYDDKREGIMIAENIRLLRKRAGMSQEEAADIAGTSRQTFSKWEAGESTPDILACDKLAEAFGVTLDDLLHYEEEEERLPMPPKGKHMFGTVTVGARGQIVLPKRAREIFHIEAGDSIIVLGDEKQGIALLKAEEMVGFVQRALKKANEKANEEADK